MAVKIYKCSIRETLSIFKKVYETIQEEDIAENLVVIKPDGVRIRRSIN